MAQNAVDKYQSLERTIDRELSKYPAMLQLERRAGIKKTNIVFLAGIGLILLLLLSWIPEITLALVAFIYPAIMTVGAIEGHDKKMDTHWLAYWLIVAGWACFEVITGGIAARIIPLYSLLKLAGCFWLFLPHTAGATMLYERTIRPVALLIRDHPTVRDASRQMSKTAGKMATEVKSAVKDTAQDAKSTLKNATASLPSSKLSTQADDDKDD